MLPSFMFIFPVHFCQVGYGKIPNSLD